VARLQCLRRGGLQRGKNTRATAPRTDPPIEPTAALTAFRSDLRPLHPLSKSRLHGPTTTTIITEPNYINVFICAVLRAPRPVRYPKPGGGEILAEFPSKLQALRPTCVEGPALLGKIAHFVCGDNDGAAILVCGDLRERSPPVSSHYCKGIENESKAVFCRGPVLFPPGATLSYRVRV